MSDLLKPRWKVIIKFPGSPFSVGQVVHVRKYLSGKWFLPECTYHPDSFPDVFKPLQWFEERKVSEMPKYLKVNDRFISVSEWHIDVENELYFISPEDDPRGTMPWNYLPATEPEYLSYFATREHKEGGGE